MLEAVGRRFQGEEVGERASVEGDAGLVQRRAERMHDVACEMGVFWRAVESMDNGATWVGREVGKKAGRGESGRPGGFNIRGRVCGRPFGREGG